MKPIEFYELIQKIASTPSKTAKEAMLAVHSEDRFLREVLEATYDPFTTYGITMASVMKHIKTAAKESEAYSFGRDEFAMLANLAGRLLTGNEALQKVAERFEKLDTPSKAILMMIIDRSCNAGFSESTINKAIPGLIPTFDCMLAHPFSEHKHKLEFPLVAEPKLDGVRVLTFVNLGTSSVNFFSRSGKEFTTFDHLKDDILIMVDNYRSELMSHASDEYDSMGLPDGEDTVDSVMDELYDKYGVDDAIELVFDSEVVSGSFNKTVSEVRKKDVQATDAKIALFDVLPMDTFTSEDKKGCQIAGPYIKRRERLEAICKHSKSSNIILLPKFEVKNEEQIHSLYGQVRERGLEGLIIKDPNGLYHRRRNHAWTKIKAEESVDVQIVDAVEGTGKYVGMLGALIIDFKGVKVNVGTGLSDSQRKTFWDAYLEDCADADAKQLVGRLCEVQYHEITPDGSLRHPRFIRFRDDKA